MVSGDKKSKSKVTATPTKTTDQTTAQRQPVPSDKKPTNNQTCNLTRASSNEPRRASKKTK